MPIIQTPVGMLPFQVDDFGKDCERSCKGALYLRPSATRRVTQAELDHLLVKYAEAKTFVVIPDPPKKKTEAVKTKPTPEPKPVASLSVDPAEEPTDPGTPSRGRRGRRGDG